MSPSIYSWDVFRIHMFTGFLRIHTQTRFLHIHTHIIFQKIYIHDRFQNTDHTQPIIFQNPEHHQIDIHDYIKLHTEEVVLVLTRGNCS